jgi:hypothetical protein
MQTFLKRLLILVLLAVAVALVWDQRHRIAGISNNKLLIQGDWYRLELDRKGTTPYTFEEVIIFRDGTEWGSYELRSNTEIDVTVGSRTDQYELSFPDSDNMEWSTWVDDKLVPAVRWRR